MKKIWILALVAISASGYCADTVIYGTKINKIYAQSKAGSTAHLIRVDASLPAICDDNRLYIDLRTLTYIRLRLPIISLESQLTLFTIQPVLADWHVDIWFQLVN
ncbi:hypothetical protein P4S72_26655 [Vibrio sp. PP-XX7]